MEATKKKPIYQNCVEIFELIIAYSTETENIVDVIVVTGCTNSSTAIKE